MEIVKINLLNNHTEYMKISVKYKHVYDADGNIIDISSVTKENKLTEYYSIGSHTPMTAALGEVNQHHFKCKRGYQINPETEIHQFAKKILKHRFETQDHFYVSYYKTKKCPLCKSCIFNDQYSPCCILEEKELTKIDLKQWYDTATIEEAFNGFIADILLTSSVKPNRKPLFIEVCVSHPCDRKKIDSKNRIIEITILNERDAYSEIIQSPLSDNNTMANNDMKPEVHFYNFKDEDTIDFCSHFSEQKKYSRHEPIFNTSLRGFTTKYYCIPSLKSNTQHPLQEYINQLQIGMLFASNSYAKPFIFDKALSLDSNSLIILGKDIYGAIKPWVVYKVNYINGNFVHRYVSGHFDYVSALRDFTIAQGKEWTGGDVLSDYC